MKRWIMAVALTATVAVASVPAMAQDSDGIARHNSIGLGFHNVEAPIGIRWWFPGQKVGLDLGLGILTDEEFDEAVTDFAFDVGIPFVAQSWDRAHILVRPGLLYESDEFADDPDLSGPLPPVTGADNRFTLSLELEAEVFLANNVSFSASHGIGFVNIDPEAGDSETRFGSLGRNFTEIGFHVYLWGPYTHR
jgi:hypothetical protein